MSTTSTAGSSTSQSIINQINSQNQAAATGSTSSSSTDTGQGLNQTFLQLLVAQLNNQDPTNPMDSTQMTSQLAQISTVSGISTLNSTVQSLVSQFQQLETMQATGLTGKSVLVAGNGLTLPSGGGSVTGGVNLGSNAGAVTVQVSDSSGNVVSTINLGPQQAGLSTFSWNGTTDAGGNAPAGNYTFAVTASQSGQAVTATAYAPQTVTGISTGTGGAPELSLGNGSQVAYGDVGRFL